MSSDRLRAVVAIVASVVLTGVLLGLISYVRNLPPPLVAEVGSENIEDVVIKSTGPVFVEFYKPSSAESKEQLKILEKVAKDYAGKVKFTKLDIVKNKKLADSLGIEDVPTHLFLFDPVSGKALIGAGPLSELELRAFIDRGLAKLNPPAPTPPSTNPTPPNTNPTPNPADPNAKPADPAVKPTTDPAKPADPTVKPNTDPAKPADPTVKPNTDPAKPADPAVKPTTDKPADPVEDPKVAPESESSN